MIYFIQIFKSYIFLLLYPKYYYLCNIKQQQEVDLIENQDRRLTAFEFKWNS